MLIPAKKDFTSFHSQPDPLFMLPKRKDSFFQDKGAGGMNPGTTGQRQAARLMKAFHCQGSQFIWNILQHIGFHGFPSK